MGGWARREQPTRHGAATQGRQPLEVCQTHSMSGDSGGEDDEYRLGSRFLQLPARATRDGARGQPVGTAVHLEVVGWRSAACPVAPPYLALAFEPSTGDVIDCRVLAGTTGFEAYEEVLWGFIRSYIDRMERVVALEADWHKPATLTSTDSALADYCFGLLQGSGVDVVCIDAKTQRVAWAEPAVGAPASEPPSGGLAADAEEGSAPAERAASEREESVEADAGGRELEPWVSGGEGPASPPTAPLMSDAMGRLFAAVEGEAATGEHAATSRLCLLGACHNDDCGRLLPRAELKRCSACKKMSYCSVACQRAHWTAGGHRQRCKDIQAMNAPLEGHSVRPS